MALLIYSGHPSIQIIVMLIGTIIEIDEPSIVPLACPRLKILIITFPERALICSLNILQSSFEISGCG